MENTPSPAGEFKPWGMEPNVFTMLLHLSQLSGFLIPFGGIILPIVMWATNKNDSELVDKHGKIVLNWVISLTIYMVVGFILIFAFVGVIIVIGLAITSIVFAIIGAIKANNGEYWEYPLSIKFFKY